MLYNKLLAIIAKDSRQMAHKWRESIRSTEYAQTYQRFNDEELEKRARDVYDTLGKWLESEASMKDIGKVYVKIGKERYLEGFPLCEVQLAIHFTKKILWDHILSEGILTNALEIYQAMDLLQRLQNFFDIASFYIIRGYLEEIYIKLGKSKEIDPAKLKHFFPEGSFLFEFNPYLL